MGAARQTTVRVERSLEALNLTIEGVAALKARPIMGGYGRAVQISNAPGSILPFPMLGRGTGGQIVDVTAGVRFDADGKSVLYGKFDFGTPRVRRKTP